MNKLTYPLGSSFNIQILNIPKDDMDYIIL